MNYDANDIAKLHGKESLGHAFDRGARSDTAAALPSRAKVGLLSGLAIEPVAVEWIWPGWLARGKLHLLAGSPGTAKTTIALSLAAAITAGGRWPDGSDVTQGDV